LSFELNVQDHETLAMKITRVIREAIIKGEFKSGERLIQDDLAKKLGVSRMPLREALKQLEVEGYLVLEPHKGAIVKSLSINEIQEIYFLRSKLEPIAMKEKFKHFSEEDINELENLSEEMLKVKAINDYIKLNIRFHSILISDCQWGRLNKMISALWVGFPQQTPRLLVEQIEESKKEHLLIVEALKNSDIEFACGILEQHIIRAGKDVIENLKNKK